MTGDEEICVGFARSEVGRVPADAQHPLAQQCAIAVRRHHRPPQRADVAVPLPVGRHSGHVLLQDVARFAIGADDARNSRYVGCDLVSAHAVAVHQHSSITEVIDTGIVEGV